MNGTLETVNSFQVDSSPAKLTDLLPHSLYFVQVSAGSQLVVGPKTLPPLQVLTQQAGEYIQYIVLRISVICSTSYYNKLIH